MVIIQYRLVILVGFPVSDIIDESNQQRLAHDPGGKPLIHPFR